MKKTTAALSVIAAAAIVWAMAMTVMAASRNAAALGTLEPDGGFDSPRLAALAKELAAGNESALAQFYAELDGKGPLVEPGPALGEKVPKMAWVTFIWRADSKAKTLHVQGGPATGDYAAKMTRLGNTDLWYRTDLVPSDSRFTYFFQVNRPVKFPPHSEKLPPFAPPRADPMNPHKLQGPERSLAELADAPPQPFMQPLPGGPKGSLKQHKMTSKYLANAWPGVETERRFSVYIPGGYDPRGTPCRLMVMFDGGNPMNPDFPLPLILDRLIHEKKIEPIVVVFVQQSAERDREVGCSKPFADFIAKELVPLVRKNYQVGNDPKHAIAAGMSGGGLMAAYCGFVHSETFGNVLAMSSAFGFWPGSLEERLDDEPGWLTRQFVSSDRAPVRFYLAAGRFENWFFPYSMLVENRRFRDVLRARGYTVDYEEFSGGHDPVCWRGPFVNGLVALAHP